MVSRRKMRRNPWGERDVRLPDSPAHQPHLPRSRKDRKRWCRGKVGVEHAIETVIHHMYDGAPFYGGCRWVPYGVTGSSVKQWHYSCRHATRCSGCGKYFAVFLPWEDCPIKDQNPKPTRTSPMWTPRISRKLARY